MKEQLLRYGYWDMSKTDFFPNCYFYLNSIYIILMD